MAQNAAGTKWNVTLWSQSDIEYVRANWGVIPCETIAATLGKTASAIIGKGRRLGLPPSALNTGGSRKGAGGPKPRGSRGFERAMAAQPEAIARAESERQQAIAAGQAMRDASVLRASREADPMPAAFRASAATRAAGALSDFDNRGYRAPRPAATPMPIPRPRECQWPFGDPGTPGFRFCDVAHDNPTSYCDEHQAIAYTPGGLVRLTHQKAARETA